VASFAGQLGEAIEVPDRSLANNDSSSAPYDLFFPPFAMPRTVTPFGPR
jgi:hypothetical protein